MKKTGQDLNEKPDPNKPNPTPLCFRFSMSQKSKTILAIVVYVLSFGLLMVEMIYDKPNHEDIGTNPIAEDSVKNPPEIPNPTTEEALILRRWERMK